MAAYDPETVAAQLNLLGSHDTPRVRTVLGGDPPGSDSRSCSRRRCRARRASTTATRSGWPAATTRTAVGRSRGTPARWDRELRDTVRALLHLRAAEPALRDGPISVVGASGAAVAYERGSGAARFVVVVNPGDDRSGSSCGSMTAAGGGPASVAMPGLASIGRAADRATAADDRIAGRGRTILRVV